MTMKNKKTIKGVLLDIFKNEVKDVEFEPSLESYYKLLDCSLIEMPTRKIGGKNFDVVCDEEGTFRDNTKISAIDTMGHVMFVGSLLIVGVADDEGNETSLSDDDVKLIMSKVQKVSTFSHPEGYLMLTECEY